MRGVYENAIKNIIINGYKTFEDVLNELDNTLQKELQKAKANCCEDEYGNDWNYDEYIEKKESISLIYGSIFTSVYSFFEDRFLVLAKKFYRNKCYSKLEHNETRDIYINKHKINIGFNERQQLSVKEVMNAIAGIKADEKLSKEIKEHRLYMLNQWVLFRLKNTKHLVDGKELLKGTVFNLNDNAVWKKIFYIDRQIRNTIIHNNSKIEPQKDDFKKKEDYYGYFNFRLSDDDHGFLKAMFNEKYLNLLDFCKSNFEFYEHNNSFKILNSDYIFKFMSQSKEFLLEVMLPGCYNIVK